MLGMERDNDLWMRAHVGTRDGRKGSAPLGRNYFLSNWEIDKRIYHNGFFSLKLSPFLDTGKITDPLPGLGSGRWLWDTGVQAKFRVLGVGVTSFTVRICALAIMRFMPPHNEPRQAGEIAFGEIDHACRQGFSSRRGSAKPRTTSPSARCRP